MMATSHRHVQSSPICLHSCMILYEIDRQTERQTDKRKDREKDRQTDREKDRRQTDRDRVCN